MPLCFTFLCCRLSVGARLLTRLSAQLLSGSMYTVTLLVLIQTNKDYDTTSITKNGMQMIIL